jgi:hypothetical protein
MQPKQFTKRELQLEKKYLDIAKETKRSEVVACDPLQFLSASLRQKKKRESRSSPFLFPWSWKLYIICKGITTSYLLLCF